MKFKIGDVVELYKPDSVNIDLYCLGDIFKIIKVSVYNEKEEYEFNEYIIEYLDGGCCEEVVHECEIRDAKNHAFNKFLEEKLCK